jgi:serine protease AprX
MTRSVLSVRRLVATLGALALATTVATPAHAGTPLAGPAGITDGITIPGIIGQAVPTGWLYDGSATTLAQVRSAIGADTMWQRGYTGKGIGVALIDTGVVPVTGLTSGNVVNGPDLSFESQSSRYRYLDTFGHGTHMAGIIAGRDKAGAPTAGQFRGIAPDVELTSVKTATSDGAVDVSQIVAAVDWVVAHRNDDKTHPIRVLNLSYGTDGTQDYRVDPLTHALENAWRAGIVVVAAGGNQGVGSRLDNPAYDPRVIAVGASDLAGTPAVTADDTVPDFSSRGDASRRVDLTAPGRSIVSLRDPGSYIDAVHSTARYQDRFFKGSGSSQAAAVVSGAVALLLDQRPGLSPDQVKALLRRTASPMPLADSAGRGAGEINLAAASLTAAPTGTQTAARSTGTGRLEASRGTQHVADGDTQLTGERDILGPWNAKKWAAASSAGTAWVKGSWNGRSWTGTCWCTTTWAGKTWSPVTWSGQSWSGRSWSGRSWSGRSWSGRSWSGDGWQGRSWSGRSWSGRSWS